MLFGQLIFAQDNNQQENDTTKTGVSLGEIKLKTPPSITDLYEYDADLDLYVQRKKVGNYTINYPVILTPAEFRQLVIKTQIKSYFKEKSDAIAGKKEGTQDQQDDLLPDFYVNSSFFESVFGGNAIDITPTGFVGMNMGVRYQKNDNPALSPRNRSNLSFDFDQRISLSLLGHIGSKLSVNAQYDTEATFDFQNLVKLEYTPNEDDILQKIEIGNVSMPLNSSLITGAQSLFGVKTQLQFGKTKVTAVFSEQRSQSRSVVAEGGGTVNNVTIQALDYDEDKHFFLSHYFRDHYDEALENYPYINSQVQITRIEVWVTNRSQNTTNVRNVVGIQDLGEPEADNTRINQNAPGGFFNTSSAGSLPRNAANDYDPTQIGGTSALTTQIRDVATVKSGFGSMSGLVNQGYDYAVLENATKLQEGTDFQLNTQLGYISLSQRLSNDEVLAVAFQYTYKGQVYQVGEFANDGVNATTYETGANGQVTAVNNQALVLKLLKSNITNVNDPIWDLMMKNIYYTGAYQLSQDDFRLNILYTDPSPANYISPVDESTWPTGLDKRVLLNVFHFDQLNAYGDVQNGGDGIFDYQEGLTINSQYGTVIFTKVEPFGKYLYKTLGDGGNYNDPSTYNANQSKYVYRSMYKLTKAAAQEDSDKNKFQLKVRYKSTAGDGIAIGAYNVPQGSVKVTAGGRLLQEGIDYTVNYAAGTVQILDESLKASGTPIEISVENNAVFGQQTRRFSGVNVEHQFSKNFILGATLLHLSERPLTQKSSYGSESVNNTIFGINGNFSTEVPLLTRLVNKLPNIDTDVMSNFSVRGEFAYLMPGTPKSDDFDGETTAYLDDFEGAQALIDVHSPLAWKLASTPLSMVPNQQLYGSSPDDPDNLRNGYGRARLSWYAIDPIFYTNQRPTEISDADVSDNDTRRIYINEIFPETDIAQGQTTVQSTLDLAYYPEEKGPYNNNPSFTTENRDEKWGGIMRGLSSTNFEQNNIEYIQFWVLDPYSNGKTGTGGELVFDLGNISEDVLKDGRKQYENGLPGVNSNDFVSETSWGKVPSAQSLVYAFDASEQNRGLQDVGLDGLSDAQEAQIFTNNSGTDPALDNYQYYLNASGGILQRYKNYNNTDGNSPIAVSNTNRGATTLPDVEDVNGDLTMNTINSYFEYKIPITNNIQSTDRYVNDIREVQVKTPDNRTVNARWIQYKIPIKDFDDAVGGISDLRSISFMRMYLTGFNQDVVLRFGTLDLVRGDWRNYTKSLQPDVDSDPSDDGTLVDVSTVNIQENETRTPIPYRLPPGVTRESINNNNSIIRQNEQSLSFKVSDLQSHDSRGVYKNLNFDMRRYKKLKMFVHAEAYQNQPLSDGELVAFLRIGTDFTDNFYQIEVPLSVTQAGAATSEEIWPSENNLEVAFDLLSKIKSEGLANGTLQDLTFYDSSGNEIDEFADRSPGEIRVGIKGNPSLGSVRSIMIGVKNASGNDASGEIWFNELRLAELDNKGGWAATAAIDANVADFASISATGNMSTVGFGALDQTPGERSLSDSRQYSLNTSVNLGQLLPKKAAIQLPLNYSVSEELITPEYDPLYDDLKLKDRIDAETTADGKKAVRKRAEEYTKRRSINFIGVRKNKSAESKKHFYDVENFTLNYSYNETQHRDFEIENAETQNINTGFVYNYNFEPLEIAPFKNKDSVLTGKYWQWLKDFNLNLLPTSLSLNSNINRTLNKQRFRDVDFLGTSQGDFLQSPELQQRNFLFNWQFGINYNLTKSLRLNFTASNYNIIRSYYDQDENGDRIINTDFGIWDEFWNTGEPNHHAQQLQLNYDLPFDKILPLNFIKATYTYTGDFDWQRGSDAQYQVAGENLNIIQNASTHTLNSVMSMDKLYNFLGLKAKKRAPIVIAPPTPTIAAPGTRPGENQEQNKSGGFKEALIDFVTMVKRLNVNYSENNGKVLPGYTQSIGFIGTLKPSFGFVFGSQDNIRYEAAKRGWLTTYEDFNQQYLQTTQKQLDIAANLLPMNDLTIDLTANRMYSDSYAENFSVNDLGNGQYRYQYLLGNRYGDFSISSLMIKTAFGKAGDFDSKTFQNFRDNRLIVAQRLAGQPINPLAQDYPEGYGANNQAVMLPAFYAAYTGKSAEKVNLEALRSVPLPNWNVKYTGLMRLDWFKDRFRRFSLSHGYRSSYSLNSFRTNLEYSSETPDEKDDSGNYLNATLYTNTTMVDEFNPLLKVDFEMKNALNIQAELRKDRALSLSFDNNLLTEIVGKEYIVGLGYRFKDVQFVTSMGGNRTVLKGDLNLKADLSLRDNVTIIRNLDINTNQITAGQNIWALKFTADYALTKNLTAQFYYDHSFSKYKISTAYPQTTIRSGLSIQYNFGN
ncbi:cell surface protein SprA [Zhouia sp. PK063]|uniref:T9SS outer membrane translocon Sov/SprA n=1 Tax=Zhouia sp. PK063 TaxID=3373602 RepID=UPI0037AEDAD2